jgi:hypothetical protein
MYTDIMRNDAGINGDAQSIDRSRGCCFLKYTTLKSRLDMARINYQFPSSTESVEHWRRMTKAPRHDWRHAANFVTNTLFPVLKGKIFLTATAGSD